MPAPDDVTTGTVGDLQLELRRVGYGQPDALRLIEEVQGEYVARYGGRDDTPLEHAMFEPPTGSFFVAYLAGEPVASGAWRRHRVAAFGTTNSAEIKRMYVAPSARGLGLARRMLAHLEESAAAAGAEAMVLETGTKQPEAIALYTSSGYSPIPGFGHYRDAPESRCFGKLLAATPSTGVSGGG
jgi:GNAT superfamily N-acetyltransferase